MGEEDKPLIVLLWTGGWDSTFRLLQLSEQDLVVQPVYIVDPIRKGTAYEQRAMSRILDMVRPASAAHIEDIIFFNKSDVLRKFADPEISAAYRRLHERYGIGAQYEWFALLSAGLGLPLEAAVVDSRGEAKSRRCISGEGHLEIIEGYPAGNVYRTVSDGPDKALELVMGHLILPLTCYTKVDEQEAAREKGWMKVMEQTWFCHSPINGQPCGLCNPCVDAMEFGMAWRMPAASQERYRSRDRLLAQARAELEAEAESGKQPADIPARAEEHRQLFKRVTGRELDLTNPQDLNEKLQWLMVYRYDRNVSRYADKLAVRDYVRECGYGDRLPQIYGVYQHVWDIKFEQLPPMFMLKCNHGSGPQFYTRADRILGGDSGLAERELVKMEQALALDYSNVGGEYHYRYISPLIYAEEYLGDDPIDYKFFCFGGKAEFVKVIAGRSDGKHQDYYDMNWKFRPMVRDEYSMGGGLPRPDGFEEMKAMAEKLSEPFPMARVDLYNIEGRILFGEITLTPATGLNRTDKPETLQLLGSLVKLDTDVNGKKSSETERR